MGKEHRGHKGAWADNGSQGLQASLGITMGSRVTMGDWGIQGGLGTTKGPWNNKGSGNQKGAWDGGTTKGYGVHYGAQVSKWGQGIWGPH